MSLDDNKALARHTLEEGFNRGNLDAIDAGFAADAVIHDPGLDMRGPAELRHGLGVLLAAFPDFHFTVEQQLAEGDLVAIRYRGQGTHRATFLGIEATGNHIDYTGIILLRLKEGQIAEFWAQPDQLSILKQLGAKIG
jgi:predicted ester cyclase